MTTKEIAAVLGLSPSTIDSYIADAVKALGAPDRRTAARAFAAHEPLPQQSGSELPRVAPAIQPDAGRVSSSEQARPIGLHLPIRRNGLVPADLPKWQRLFWIVGIPVAISVGFGMLMSGLDVLGRFVTAVAHQLQ